MPRFLELRYGNFARYFSLLGGLRYLRTSRICTSSLITGINLEHPKRFQTQAVPGIYAQNSRIGSRIKSLLVELWKNYDTGGAGEKLTHFFALSLS